MSAVGGTVRTAETVRSAAATLVDVVEQRAAEIAEARRLPADLVGVLKQAGVFSMPMPRTWGGPEMTLRQQVEVIELLSAADPSVGWCAMIGSDAGFYSAFLDDEAARSVWPDLDAVTAGWVFPAGRARRRGDGFVVDGRWSFGSGCTHADVIVGGCVEFDGDVPVTTEQGLPVVRIVIAPAQAWTVHDTWFTTGLAGSGSHDYSVQGLIVPAERTFSFLDRPRRPGPLYAFPGAFFANMSGVPLGLARRAIDVALQVAGSKVYRPRGNRMREEPRVRLAIARAETDLGAARAYVYDALDRMWDQLETDGVMTTATRVHLALSRANAFRMARDVAQQMVDVVGTEAIFTSSPLDRLLRDAVTMKQHVVAQDRALELVGGLVLGEEPPFPFL
ncbi:acyl-CoA dehydrogenase family protein [Geodermatophilus sp. SYSU D00710]